MKTELLFRDDAYLRSCTAKVIAVHDRGIELDRTVFYPAGGGQPGDIGELRRADGLVDRADLGVGHRIAEALAGAPRPVAKLRPGPLEPVVTVAKVTGWKRFPQRVVFLIWCCQHNRLGASAAEKDALKRCQSRRV